MMDVEFKRQLTNQLIFTYAREILRLCRTINDKRCIGCQYNDTNQLHHDCITMTDDEVVMFHFEEALQSVQYNKIPDLYEKNAEYLNIPKDIVKELKDSFNWDWWFENNQEKQHIESRIKEALNILILFQ